MNTYTIRCHVDVVNDQTGQEYSVEWNANVQATDPAWAAKVALAKFPSYSVHDALTIPPPPVPVQFPDRSVTTIHTRQDNPVFRVVKIEGRVS